MLTRVLAALLCAAAFVLGSVSPAHAFHFSLVGLTTGATSTTPTGVVSFPAGACSQAPLGFLSTGGGCCGGTAMMGWAVQPAVVGMAAPCTAAAPAFPMMAPPVLPVAGGGCCGGAAPAVFAGYGYSTAYVETNTSCARMAGMLRAMDGGSLSAPGDPASMTPAELTEEMRALTRTVEALTRTVQRHDAALRQQPAAKLPEQ